MGYLQASIKTARYGDTLARPGQLRACSRASIAPFDFLSFFTRASTAFSAHFSSSSPCFHPRSFLTAGEVNEKRELRLVMVLTYDSSGCGRHRRRALLTHLSCTPLPPAPMFASVK